MNGPTLRDWADSYFRACAEAEGYDLDLADYEEVEDWISQNADGLSAALRRQVEAYTMDMDPMPEIDTGGPNETR